MNFSEISRSLSLPVIVAPMLLVSGPDLVVAACRAGLVGSFPAANARTAEDCEAWLTKIDREIELARQTIPAASIAPYALNIIVRTAGTERFEADLGLARRFRVPIIITSVGNPGENR